MTAATLQPAACPVCGGTRQLPVVEAMKVDAVTMDGRPSGWIRCGRLRWRVTPTPCTACCCAECGDPCEYPPLCRECAGREEAGAKRRDDR